MLILQSRVTSDEFGPWQLKDIASLALLLLIGQMPRSIQTRSLILIQSPCNSSFADQNDKEQGINKIADTFHAWHSVESHQTSDLDANHPQI